MHIVDGMATDLSIEPGLSRARMPQADRRRPRLRTPPCSATTLNLALRSFRNKALTALMVLAIALGIGTSMTTLTVFHVLSGDPIPDKSDRLFYVQLDPEPMRGYRPGEEPQSQLTRFDSETLLKQKRGLRQTLTSGGGVVIES